MTLKKPADGTIFAYESFELKAEAAPANRAAILQGKSSTGWSNSRTGTTDASGKVTFTLASALPERDFRVLIPSSKLEGPVLSEPRTVKTKANTVGLVLNRVGSKIVADGYLSADQPGRVVELQKATRRLDQGRRNSAGRQQPCGLRGRAEQVDELPPGGQGLHRRRPAGHLEHVRPHLRTRPRWVQRVAYVTRPVTVAPRPKRGMDYLGTIKMSGVTASLETVAVRGNSSADYKKQGYKLKFDDNHPAVRVCPRARTSTCCPTCRTTPDPHGGHLHHREEAVGACAGRRTGSSPSST